MKNILFILILFGFFPFIKAQDYNYNNLSVRFETQNKDFYQFENLRLYPIRANSSFLKYQKSIGKYIPLKKAITNNQILITEMKGDTNIRNENTRTNIRQPPTNQRRILDDNRISNRNSNALSPRNQIRTEDGEVNTLMIQNICKDTIYIMAGEIIQGGKQDRVIAKDIVLPPSSPAIDVSVFCVEQGRWEYEEQKIEKNKNFQKYYGTASLKLRAKVEKEQNQQAVWGEVRRSNNENNTKTETQAYTAQNNSKDFQQKNQKYVDYFTKIFTNDKETIGVVVVTGNQVVGVDMFASVDLFQSQIGSLLTSYANEAITDGKEVNIEPNIVREYMDNLLSNNQQKQNEFLEKRGKKVKHKEINLRMSTF
ncbi:MAG: hypothetical protein EAZ85_10715 [Bacteroidetes bacterium]|nr:MAG: hypothetical protein EAZ85_10715 [Bacteroidota bacterium]TAG86133.1 MAG: hypothetical protein EAZ20_13405 [Bacteroidota bacterium]